MLEIFGEMHDVSETLAHLNDTQETTRKQIEDQHKDDIGNELEEHHESIENNGEKDKNKGEGGKDKNKKL